jgi:hypothetical protein
MTNVQIKNRNCISCKVDKPCTPEYFYRDKNRPEGLMYRCKQCDKNRIDNRTWAERKANFSQEQIDRKNQQNKKYRKTEKGYASCHVGQYKYFDKKRGFFSDLNTKDLIEVKKGNCFYCGFKATGFDRKDNSKGHTKDNCVPCCKDCNCARMDNFTHEEMVFIGKAIREVKLKRLNK